MSKGFFELTGFEGMGENDILKTQLESGEFAPNSNATNDVSNHTSDAKVNVPGGTGESPSAKPEGGEHGPTPPGGFSEKPANHGPEYGPSIPQKTELTTDEWNRAMNSLKQSFKEGVELMEMLEHCKIVEETPEMAQQRYLENAMNEAYYEAMISGPLYEAVKRSDKDEIKGIVKKCKKLVSNWCDENKVKFRRADTYAKFCNIGWFTTRLWQVIGAVYIEAGNADSVVAELNKECAEELGDYKIIGSAMWCADIIDLFKVKFNWKNEKGICMLVVDKKLPYEFTKKGQLEGSSGDGEGGESNSLKKDQKKDGKGAECKDGECKDDKK